jgi:muramoyltetrapeptide carboxypeptidase
MPHFKSLSSGDSINIIAPASAAPVDRLNNGLEWIHQQGYQAHLPKDLLKPRLFFASPLENQVRHVKEAFKSDALVLWCLRGGYGSARLIPYLEKLKKPVQKKLLIGFSDITALHLYLGQKWGWPTIHGRVLTQMDPKAKRRPDLKMYRQLLDGKIKSLTYSGLVPMNDAAKKSRTVSGPVTGGNLRLLECSIGTGWELEARGKILFLEDVGERGYSVHRMLVHLTQAGLLEGVRAIVLGDFTEGLETDGKDRTREALQAFADESSIPVLRGMPCGHGEKNHPLPFHTKATLKLGKRGVLKVATGF